MATIRINYEQALAQAKKLSDAAQDCRQEANKAQRIANELASSWQGDSGSAMQDKYSNWIKEQRAIAGQLEAAAGTIRKVVEEIKREDEAQAAAIRGATEGMGSMVKSLLNSLKGPKGFN